jgi:hypothetical protein
MRKIVLDFGKFRLNAELFDNDVAEKLWAGLPAAIELERWGGELYGPLGFECGTENPVPEIPAGGIAYSKKGRYLCLFFGQTPAWPVDHIGKMEGWERLKTGRVEKVKISRLQ